MVMGYRVESRWDTLKVSPFSAASASASDSVKPMNIPVTSESLIFGFAGADIGGGDPFFDGFEEEPKETEQAERASPAERAIATTTVERFVSMRFLSAWNCRRSSFASSLFGLPGDMPTIFSAQRFTYSGVS